MQVPSYPKTVNIYNLKNFFNFKAVNPRQILPGTIVQFSYRSPEGVHDTSPLIYVLEAEQDRVWGINLHYKFSLLGEIIEQKKAEVLKANPPQVQQPIQEVSGAAVKPEQLNQKHVPSLPEFKKTLGIDKQAIPQKKVVVPIQLLENYILTNQPKELLRNYLYPRMTNIQKLVFKTL
jgi:hypothetical protein